MKHKSNGMTKILTGVAVGAAAGAAAIALSDRDNRKKFTKAVANFKVTADKIREDLKSDANIKEAVKTAKPKLEETKKQTMAAL